MNAAASYLAAQPHPPTGPVQVQQPDHPPAEPVQQDAAEPEGNMSEGTPPVRHAVFAQPGPLGITWWRRRDSGAAVIKTVREGGPADAAGLVPNLLLETVNGDSAEAMGYSAAVETIKGTRPLLLQFAQDPVEEQSSDQVRQSQSSEQSLRTSPAGKDENAQAVLFQTPLKYRVLANATVRTDASISTGR